MNVDVVLEPENIRLLIWDLDDTFWSGTLTEGGVSIPEQNVNIVRTLSERGIINSICSKNDLNGVKAELEGAGIWDLFVLPRIAWEGKGAMVSSIVEASQLRPETIMFIDDNPINLNEVKHYNPKLQMADPSFLETLLNDPRFSGKPDPELKRLAQYKVLEKKGQDLSKFADSNTDFLRQSEIRISFHQDVLGEFDRVHDLINRTNQLNFTKLRISEDRDCAYAKLERQLDDVGVHAAYIKVSDKYGAYGIVGFYMSVLEASVGRKLRHFLFSCRTLNMGIEQFVYRKLGRPKLDISGEVVAEVSHNQPIDWITVVADAEQRAIAAPAQSLVLCMRGSCDLDQLIHYLGHRFHVLKEFPFPYKGGLVPMSAAQFISIFDALQKPEHKLLIERLPFLHPHVLKSATLGGNGDVYVVSFAMEEQWHHFRYKPTGLILPMRFAAGVQFPYAELTSLPFEQIEPRTKLEFTSEHWRWFQDNFEYAGGFDSARFASNIRDLLNRLMGKKLIFVLANTRHGPPCGEFEINARINAIIEREAASFPVDIIRFDDLVFGVDEVRNANHFHRPVFPRLAAAVLDLIDGAVAPVAARA